MTNQEFTQWRREEGANRGGFNIQPLSNYIPVTQTVVVYAQTSSEQNGDMRFVFHAGKTTECLFLFSSVLKSLKIKLRE